MREFAIDIEERDWLYSLVCIRGVGRTTIRTLYETVGSFALLANQLPNLLPHLSLPTGIAQILLRTLRTEHVYYDKEQRLRDNYQFICFLDHHFPPMLYEIPDPPLLLFYDGDLRLLERPMIGVVGSRRPTPYGRAACAHLTKQLSEAGFVIVSGLAHGIDGEAHRVALRCGNGTVAVLGCGIDQIYPSAHRSLYGEIASAGLLLSEYPPGTPPVQGLFPERNRLISGVSLGILVVEAAERSGSLITADCALEQGKDVFAVPGPIFSDLSAGPHNLMKQGAKLVTSSLDIATEFVHLLPQTQPSTPCFSSPLDTEEQSLFEMLSHDPIHWNELYAQILPEKRTILDRTLIQLEIKGLVASLPGGYYARR